MRVRNTLIGVTLLLFLLGSLILVLDASRMTTVDRAIIERNAASEPLRKTEAARLKCNISDQSCDLRRVILRGKFDHENERHVVAKSSIASNKNGSGYFVFTPMFLETETFGEFEPSPILVNRGFVPDHLKEPYTRQQGQVQGGGEILARIRTRELRNLFSQSNIAHKNIYYVKDPGELGFPYPKQTDGMHALQVNWFYFEMIGEPPLGGYPLPASTQFDADSQR